LFRFREGQRHRIGPLIAGEIKMNAGIEVKEGSTWDLKWVYLQKRLINQNYESHRLN